MIGRMHRKSPALSRRFHLCEESRNNVRFGLMAFPSLDRVRVMGKDRVRGSRTCVGWLRCDATRMDSGYRVTLAIASVTLVKQIERAAQRADGLRISLQRCPRGRIPRT